jgi:hypothetical protein
MRIVGVDLLRVYGMDVAKNGIAFMYSNRSDDIIQALRAMWTDMGDYLSR